MSLNSTLDIMTFVTYLVNDDLFNRLVPMNSKLRNNLKCTLLLNFLVVMGMVFGSLEMQAQGWEIYFGSDKDDFGEAILQTRDQGYIVAGFSQVGGVGNNLDLYIVRVDVDGDEVWSKFYNEGFLEHAYDIIPATDGGYIVVGDIKKTQTDEFDVFLLKINESGEVVWKNQYGGSNADIGSAVASTSDGGYIITGRTKSFGAGEEDVYLIKTDVDGNEEWSQTFGDIEDDRGRDVIPFGTGYAIVGSFETPGGNPPITSDLYLILTDADGNEISSFLHGDDGGDEGLALTKTIDGGLIITGLIGNNSDVYLIKTDQDGNEEWSKTFGGSLIDIGNDVIQLEDGSYVIAGVTEVNVSNPDLYLLKVDSNGDLIWDTTIGRNDHWDEGKSIVKTLDGGFVIGGINSFTSGSQLNDISIFKTNAAGNIHTNFIQGKVLIDEDDDCFPDVNERALQDWLVFAQGAETYFGTTDVNGNYSIRVDTGTYEVILLPKNPYWDICEDTIMDVVIDMFYDTTFIDFSVKKAIDCPFMDVDISVPFLLPCSTDDFVISFCNNGTTDADSAYVAIALDEDLIYNSASINPIQIINDSLYIFDLDTLEVGECGSFTINATLDCNATAGEAVFVYAHMFPDTVCLPIDPNWDMASLKVEGFCDTDSVRFKVTNVGTGDMDEPQSLVIIEDIVIGLVKDDIDLDVGAFEALSFPADGKTYRIVAEQPDGHPGDSYPTVSVEGCDNGVGGSSIGQVTQFQEDENNSFISIEVQESISSTDAVLDLRGYPKGYITNDSAFITANTDLEYHLLFQNTGTDTITRLVIRDTLSAYLDLTSVSPGASSHPYDFKIYDNGILKFTFENLQLTPADSGTDSFGFVKFKVAQKPNNPIGTQIDNSAAIFLGYEEPVQTITKTHFIGGDSIEEFVIITGLEESIDPTIQIKAYPNPFFETTKIEILGGDFNEVTLTLFDMMGRKIRKESFSDNQIQFDRDNLPSGTYIYTLEANGRLLNSGKIIAL